jgi:hypothetical protein
MRHSGDVVEGRRLFRRRQRRRGTTKERSDGAVGDETDWMN